MTLLHRFLEIVQTYPEQRAVMGIAKNHVYSLSWQDVLNRCQNYAGALSALNVGPGDRVLIYGNTCKEWGFLDMAIMALGAVTVPIYHSSHQDDVDHIVADSGAHCIFVENEILLKKLRSTPHFKHLKTVVLFAKTEGSQDNDVPDLEEILDDASLFSFEVAVSSLELEQLATVIYTSGTSGLPKGVALTHRQVMSSVSEVYPLLGITAADRSLTFLPFSHVLGRLELWGSFYTGFTIGYAQSIDRIKKNLAQIQPTVFVGVPRIFEKIFYGIRAQVDVSPLKRRLFRQALALGKIMTKHRERRTSPSLMTLMQYQLARKMVLGKISQRMGGRVRFAVSGGAPLDPEISQFFEACGMPILEGYGLTESTGSIFVNTLFNNKLGTVGQAIGDVEVRFAKDGEILVRSDKIMQGYFQNPEASQKAFTQDGYFKTGDIGELDEDRFLKITDRKKDLIKTAGGKFVAPQKLQQSFSTTPLISYIHIHGDKKKYIVGLVSLDAQALMEFKDKEGLSETSFQALSQDPLVKAEVRRAVASANKNLSSFETIKKYKILDHEFSIAGGQLTPSLKMKRKNIDVSYKVEIEALYD